MAGAMGGFLAGSIVAKMVLDKTGWNSSISSIQGNVKTLKVQTGTLGESVSAMAKTWGLAGIAIIGTISSMIMKNADYMDSLDEMSTRTGVGVEDLSSYKLVLDASGASLDSFAFGMKTLASKMADARNGNLAAIKTFRDLNIAFQNADGSLRPLNDVFLDMADRFRAMGDTPERAAMAVDALGRAGMALIPTLDLGRNGIKQFTDRAKELGLVVSSEAAKSASDFKDKVGELRGALDGAIQKIVIQLLPALTEMVTKLVPVVQKLMEFLDKTKILQTEVDTFAFKIGLLTDAFNLCIKAMETVAGAISWIPGFKKDTEDTIPGVGLFAGIIKTVSDNMKEGAAEGKRLAAEIRGVGTAAEIAAGPISDLAAEQLYLNLIWDRALPKSRNLLECLTKYTPLVEEIAYSTEGLGPITEKTTSILQEGWEGLYADLAQGWGDLIAEYCAGGMTLQSFMKGIWDNIKLSFFRTIGEMASKWLIKLLKDVIIDGTAAATAQAAGGLATMGTAVATLATTLATFMTTIATGIATALVTLATAIATSAAIIAAAAPEILIAGAVAAAIYGMFAGVSALLGGGGGKSSDVTYWLKPMSERLQEIRDYLFIVLEGQHLGYMHVIMVDDNKCLWDLVYKGQSIINLLGSGFPAVVNAIGKIKGAQHGYVAMSNELVMVHGTPTIPEIILPEPIYERNLQMAAAMGGGQPGQPIELYINSEPVKFSMRENIRKIAIDLIPYMTKNEQLKIHPRSVRTF